MKILVAFHSILPHIGGVSTYVNQLSKGLRDKGHTVEIMALHPSQQGYYMMNTDRIVDLSMLNKFSHKILTTYYKKQNHMTTHFIRNIEKMKYNMELAAALFDLNQYDVIHAQCAISTLALSRIKNPNTPLISTLHSTFKNDFTISRNPRDKQYFEFLEQRSMEVSDLTLAPSEALRQELIKNRKDLAEKVVTLHSGIDITNLRNRAKRQQNPFKKEGKQQLIYPARLVQEKGHFILIEALAMLKKVRQDWLCLLAGNGPEKASIEQAIKKQNLEDHVQILDNEKDIAYLLAESDLCVFPSLTENLPYGIMEAQSMGLPVIATKVGGIPEMIKHGETGLLISPSDSQALFKSLEQLMKDEKRKQALSEMSKQWAENHWSINRMTDSIMTIYSDELRESKLTERVEDKQKRSRTPNRFFKYLNTFCLPDHYKLPDPNTIHFFEK
ncbi:glycosyltransferase family 4 protein [Pullulanibacillus sp. KACC 23026]|uniref:glycosyltransferase family 4 protein n=1 Tax=Pullulanibacillus sp. KACC 23026 TaxID=3028315 RepID=UPI0023AEC1FB|nr:glycosyltransferase family 4 protein [Pullulanibacillus sp. KACC 23026]WEG10995.1 glycosyltransferase family 4 protein [Pullulanibacillus sp. KACC 23026]